MINLFTEQNNFLIIGKKGSGKSALGWHLVETIAKIGNKKAYIFRHPNIKVLKTLPFPVENIISMGALSSITDGVVIIDEAHMWFNYIEKKINLDLQRTLANSRQNNTTFIFITHNSFFINRGLFTYVDVKIIKEVSESHWETERTHMKRLYSHVHVQGKEEFYIDSDYIQSKERFDKPKWFSEELSMSFRSKEKEEDFFSKVHSALKCTPMRKSAPGGKKNETHTN